MKLKTRFHLLFLLIILPCFLSCKAKQTQPKEQGFVVTEKDGVTHYQSFEYGLSLEFSTTLWKIDSARADGLGLQSINTISTDLNLGKLDLFFGPSKWHRVKVDDMTIPIGVGPGAFFLEDKKKAKTEKWIKITQSTFIVNNITFSSIVEEPDVLPGIAIRDAESEDEGTFCQNNSYFYAEQPVPIYVHHNHYSSGCFLAYGKESSGYQVLIKTRKEVFKVIKTLKFVGTLPQAGK